MKTSSSSEKCQKVRKFWNFTIGCRVPKHKQKSKFDQDETSSSWEKNWETLQLAAECHSMTWNQSLIKKTSSSCQKLRNADRMPQHKKKSKFDQDQTSSSWEKCQKLRNLWNFAIGYRMPQHKKNKKFDQDNTNSSWEICKKVKKIWKLYNWLQSAMA